MLQTVTVSCLQLLLIRKWRTFPLPTWTSFFPNVNEPTTFQSFGGGHYVMNEFTENKIRRLIGAAREEYETQDPNPAFFKDFETCLTEAIYLQYEGGDKPLDKYGDMTTL